jgi:carbonic anhydrase/acetyltransferase-like protein (isoleucine patch superfamily)
MVMVDNSMGLEILFDYLRMESVIWTNREVAMIRSFDGKTPQIAESAFISEEAYVIGDVEIGENSGIFPGAIIRGDFAKIKVGQNTMVEDNCVIHTGVPIEIGDNIIFGHSVVVHCLKIGNNCLIGNNSILLDNSKIGNYCIVAAGCLVPQGMIVPDYSMVMGLPGVVTSLPPERRRMLQHGSQAYAPLLEKYKRQPELKS